jgi:hypothetical protein
LIDQEESFAERFSLEVVRLHAHAFDADELTPGIQADFLFLASPDSPTSDFPGEPSLEDLRQ